MKFGQRFLQAFANNQDWIRIDYELLKQSIPLGTFLQVIEEQILLSSAFWDSKRLEIVKKTQCKEDASFLRQWQVLNYLAVLKACKKHDKHHPSSPATDPTLDILMRQPFVKDLAHEPIFANETTDRTCPVCCQNMVNPFTLKCQHEFCYICLKNCSAYGHSRCPLCRTKQALDPVCQVIDCSLGEVAEKYYPTFEDKPISVLNPQPKNNLRSALAGVVSFALIATLHSIELGAIGTVLVLALVLAVLATFRLKINNSEHLQKQKLSTISHEHDFMGVLFQKPIQPPSGTVPLFERTLNVKTPHNDTNDTVVDVRKSTAPAVVDSKPVVEPVDKPAVEPKSSVRRRQRRKQFFSALGGFRKRSPRTLAELMGENSKMPNRVHRPVWALEQHNSTPDALLAESPDQIDIDIDTETSECGGTSDSDMDPDADLNAELDSEWNRYCVQYKRNPVQSRRRTCKSAGAGI